MTADAFEPIRHQHGRPMLLAGLRRYHGFAESVYSITEQWQQFQSLGPIPGHVGSTTYGVMCGEVPGGFEYLCGAEVEAFASLPGNMGRMRITPQRYAVFLHPGHISAIRKTWERIRTEWLPGSGHDSAHRPDFEVYDQRFDPRTGLGGVEIWIAITHDNHQDA